LKKRIMVNATDDNVDTDSRDEFAPAATSASSCRDLAKDVARVDPSKMDLTKEWEDILFALVEPIPS